MKTDKYKEIINMPYPFSYNISKIKKADRAAQFASFAALTGYEDEIEEKGRLTENKNELDENEIAKLNEKLVILKNLPEKIGEVLIEYFVSDKLKDGGKYILKKGYVKYIDEYKHTVVFFDGTVIPINDISDIWLLHQIEKLE